MASGSLGKLLGVAIVTAAITLGVGRAATHHVTRPADLRAARATGAARLVGKSASFSFHPTTGKISVRSADGALARDLTLSLIVDGDARPLSVEHAARRTHERNAFGVSFPVTIGEETFDVLVTLRVDPATDGLFVELTAKGDDATVPHAFALRLEVPTEGETAFVSGAGEVADLGEVHGRVVEIDAPPRALGIAGGHGDLVIEAVPDEHPEPGTPLWIAATTAAQTPTATQPAVADLRFAVGASSARIWKTLHALAGERTANVHGVVTGAKARARVFGLDGEGLPRVRASVEPDGRFDLDVPPSVVEWYAALDPSRTSAPLRFEPGTPWDLRLDVSPGGELRVRVTDADTGEPLVARMLVRGIDGTIDPSFGPDFRASGAGPIVDALQGELATPIPAGRYRVSATKGIEWSIDAKTVDVVSGRTAPIDLALRHVVPTPGIVACDLHVHARPSFDSPVTPEDRVLSLVSAGIDFAVPSEHNIVGDYGPALDTLGLSRDLAFVTGVEVTTFAPRWGHFGLFPFPRDEKPPPYKGTNPNAIFRAAKRSDPNRVLQVNHPRLPMGIGYFEIFHFDPKKPPPIGMRTDFDTIEVYNGYDLATPGRVDAVMRDWFALLDDGHRYAATGSSDSHRIQYQWAGYPRTMALAPDDPVDVAATVTAIKKGRSFVTSGPILDVRVGDARPGDTVTTRESALTAHVTVRAAPWIDVRTIEVVVDGKSVLTRSLPERPTTTGPELGAKDEVEARTVRFDEDVAVPLEVTPGAPRSAPTWFVVVARGTRKLDDVLPFMPVPPLAFTNPIFVDRR